MKTTLTPEVVQAKQTKSVCEACGKKIKYDYWYGEQMLGIECWKKIALPQIKADKERQFEERMFKYHQETLALVEALKAKDYSKIRSEFKLKFLHDLIDQFEEQGFVSGKQKDMVYGSGSWNGSFYDTGMLNDSDKVNEMTVMYLIGDDDQKECANDIIGKLYAKYGKAYAEATNQDYDELVEKRIMFTDY